MTMKAARGLTLIELLIVMAIASLVLAAAVGLFVSMASRQRTSERVVETHNAVLVGVARIQMDANNAGYRFPVPAYAVRHINNVDSTTVLPSMTSPASPTPGAAPISVTGNGNCGAAGMGLIAGTDVLELSQGLALSSPGRVAPAVTVVSGQFSLALDNSSVFSSPFLNAEVGTTAGSAPPGVNSILLFAGPAVSPCLARVTDVFFAGNAQVQGRLINRDYADLATAALPANCPAAGMNVYRLGQRTRYMVCGTAGTPNSYGLYIQVSDSTGSWTTPPQLLQPSIEDFQVSGRYLNNGGVMGTGGSCSGSGIDDMCFCDDASPSPTCSLSGNDIEPDLSTVAGGLTNSSRVSLIRGFRAQLTGIGSLTATINNAVSPEHRRPDSFDHAGMATPDNYYRKLIQFAVTLDNLKVVP